MNRRVRALVDVGRPGVAAVAALALVVVALPVIVLGAAPAGAATVAVTLGCGPWNGTFPIEDVTVAQGDTLEVSWDASCVHPDGDTVLRTSAALADAYFSSVPGQEDGESSGWYNLVELDATSATWVVADDAPLGQMPLLSDFEASYPFICNNCADGAAIRLTVTPGPTVPDAPGAPTGTGGDGSVTLTWSAPGDDGGLPITTYTATATPGGATCTAEAPATSCTIDGLTNGEAYTFTVLATNDVGDGPVSAASAPITPTVDASTTTTTTTTTAAPSTAPRPALRGASLSFAG